MTKHNAKKTLLNPTLTGGGGQSDPQHYVSAYKIQTV